MARRTVPALFAVLLAACASGLRPPAAEQPLAFRVLEEGQNAALCEHGPAFGVARDAGEWAAVWARGHSCQVGAGPAPALRDGEAAIVAWWRVEGCLGSGVKTTAVTLHPDATITVEADRSEPAAEFCATAIAGLESYLALDASALRGATRIRFLLDGAEAGTVSTGS